MTRIAILQAQTGIDPKRNAAALVEAIARARDEGAKMLFTPEMSGLLDRDRKRAAAQLCSQADDPVFAAVREAAASAGIWVHLGSLALRGEGDRLANRGFVIDCEGAIRASYDKLHLFDVDLASGESWRESAVYAPGTRSVIVEGTPVGRLGLTVCYDLRFPALFAALAEAGAETIAVPSAFTVPTGEAHWHVLLRARAIEAGLFVVAAALLRLGRLLAYIPWPLIEGFTVGIAVVIAAQQIPNALGVAKPDVENAAGAAAVAAMIALTVASPPDPARRDCRAPPLISRPSLL